MKIATYNIWCSERGMPYREEQIIGEISALDADVIALQEVRNSSFRDKIFEHTSYTHHFFAVHEGRDDGLAVYSKYPILYSKYIDYSLIVVVEHMGKSILLANVHLPWESILAKEHCIVSIVRETSAVSSDYRFILGDFNSREDSSVIQYLRSNTTLNGTEVTAYWTDLALVAEELLGIKREMTLDIKKNPRWKGQSIVDNSSRVDCIFMHDCFPQAYPALRDFHYFGKAIGEKSGLCASDHYGVCADLQMPYEKS